MLRHRKQGVEGLDALAVRQRQVGNNRIDATCLKPPYPFGQQADPFDVKQGVAGSAQHRCQRSGVHGIAGDNQHSMCHVLVLPAARSPCADDFRLSGAKTSAAFP